MTDISALLEQWHLDLKAVRKLIYRASSERERERWHAIWLMAKGWTVTEVAEELDRDPHTVSDWLENFRRHGPVGLTFEQSGGAPPPSAQSNRPS
jgi:transposase